MIKRECVDELGWISEATFKKTLAVYQILPGPEAHELCVYFGRIRGGKLGGFLAGLGFALPGFLLMLGALDPLRRGQPGRAPGRDLLRAERGGRGDHRPGPGQAEPELSSATCRWSVIAVVAFAVTVGLEANFVLVLLGAGLVYELWTNADRWLHRGRLVCGRAGAGVVTVIVAGAITVSLTAVDLLGGPEGRAARRSAAPTPWSRFCSRARSKPTTG